MDKKNIMTFHLFTHQDSTYMINIENMQARFIDKGTAKILEKIADTPKTSLTLSMLETLKKLGLLSKTGDKTKKPTRTEPFRVNNMSLFLTQSCNLRCIYCYGDGGEYGTGGSMDEKTAYLAVDWLIEQSGEIKKIYIEFLGGEPFLKFSLMKKVVEYATKKTLEAGKKVNFRCTTNATLLDDEKITFIKKHNMSITISFDGPKDIQDTQRPYTNGEGSYDSTLPKIKKVLAALPESHGHAVIVGNTDPKKIKDSLQKIGFSRISIVPASQSLLTDKPQNKETTRNSERLLHDLKQEAKDWICSARNRDSESLMKLKIRSGLYEALVSLLHNRKKYYPCDAGRGLVAVSVTGDVYLCHRFVGIDKYKLGSIFENHLRREEYQNSPVIENGMCISCFAKYYCAGGCKHDNLGSSGSISVPSKDMCAFRRQELELAAVIVSELESEDLAFLHEQKIFTPKPCPLDF